MIAPKDFPIAEAPKQPMSTDARAALDRYLSSHYGDLSDPENLADFMYRAGGRDIIATMVQFNDLATIIGRLEDRLNQIARVVEALS